MSETLPRFMISSRNRVAMALFSWVPMARLHEIRIRHRQVYSHRHGKAIGLSTADRRHGDKGTGIPRRRHHWQPLASRAGIGLRLADRLGEDLVGGLDPGERPG